MADNNQVLYEIVLGYNKRVRNKMNTGVEKHVRVEK